MFILTRKFAADCIAKKIKLVNEQHLSCQVEKYTAERLNAKLASSRSVFTFMDDDTAHYFHNRVLSTGELSKIPDDLVGKIDKYSSKSKNFIFGVKEEADVVLYQMGESAVARNGWALNSSFNEAKVLGKIKTSDKVPLKSPKRIAEKKVKKLGGPFSDVSHESMEKDYKSFINGLSSSDKKLVEDYTDQAFVEVNSLLREGQVASGTPKAKVEKSIKRMDKILRSVGTKKDMTVYRTMNFDMDKKFRNKRYIDKGFQSTSIDKDVVETFAVDLVEAEETTSLLKISVPKGSKGAYVEGITSYENQYEFILPRNSELVIRKKVVSEWWSGGPKVKIYECDLVE